MKSTFSSHFKIVVVGASGVGKTAIVQRLIDGTFTEDSQPTVGVAFKSFICPMEHDSVKLQIWDTAGQERFRSVSKVYFRKAVGAVLVYDITSDASFEDLQNWLRDIRQLSNPNAFVLLVGNKSDRSGEREVGIQQAKDFAQRHRLEYIETSALNGSNVTEAFTKLAYGVATRIANGQIQASGEAARVLPSPVSNEEEGSDCHC